MKEGLDLAGLQTLWGYIKTSQAGFKNITISTSEPTSSDGENGDIWLVYTAPTPSPEPVGE